MTTIDDITSTSLDPAYVWHFEPFSGSYIRGVKRVDPPDDGYEYIDVTTWADNEQKWMRGERRDDSTA